jgi:stage V sporulation protein AE
MDPLKILLSFLLGGTLCAAVQLICDKTKLPAARVLVSLTLIGIILGALDLYEPIFNIFGAGISVPLTGFGASVSKGVREAIDENGAIGILSGPFTAAATGLGAAFFFGFIFSLLSKGRPKRA